MFLYFGLKLLILGHVLRFMGLVEVNEKKNKEKTKRLAAAIRSLVSICVTQAFV